MKIKVETKRTEEVSFVVIENVGNVFQQDDNIYVEVEKEVTNEELLGLLEKLQDLGFVDTDASDTSSAPWELITSPGTYDPKMNIVEVKFNQECFEIFSITP